MEQMALHESMEVQDLLQFKTVCMTKATVMQAFVSDQLLVSVMQRAADADRRHIQDLQHLLTQGTKPIQPM